MRHESGFEKSSQFMSNVYFSYIGSTGLTVKGAVTGKLYRFVGYGAIVAVDPRDRLSLTTIPYLKQVQNV